MTWSAAMRDPAQLRRDLGTRRFLWLQIQFLGSVLGFLLAPILWSFMVKPFGLAHPIEDLLSSSVTTSIGIVMLLGLIGSMAISFHACKAPHLRHIRPFVPLLEIYYFLGTIAAWIGTVEMGLKPFFWAKTAHGRFGGQPSETGSDGSTATPHPGPRPVPHAAE